MIFNRSAISALLFTSLFVCGAQAQTAPSKSKLPSQSQLARKGAFPVYSTKGVTIQATNLAMARKNLNKTAAFSGTVVSVYTPVSNARVLLNFAANYKTAVVGLVDAKNFKQFPDLRALKGKRVVISGRVVPFKDQIEIELPTPNSIRLVK